MCSFSSYIINYLEEKIKNDTDTNAMLILGHYYIYGYENIIERDFEKGLDLCKKAADNGLNDALRIIGDGYEMDGKYQEAIEWDKKYVSKGGIFAKEYEKKIKVLEKQLGKEDK